MKTHRAFAMMQKIDAFDRITQILNVEPNDVVVEISKIKNELQEHKERGRIHGIVKTSKGLMQMCNQSIGIRDIPFEDGYNTDFSSITCMKCREM